MSKEVLRQGCTLEEEIRTGEGWLERITIVIVPSHVPQVAIQFTSIIMLTLI